MNNLTPTDIVDIERSAEVAFSEFLDCFQALVREEPGLEALEGTFLDAIIHRLEEEIDRSENDLVEEHF